MCCDNCNVGCSSSRLNILTRAVGKRRAKRVRRAISPNLETTLVDARVKTLAEHPSFKMVGVDFLCPDAAIKKLCEEAQFMNETSVAVRLELKNKFIAAAVDLRTSWKANWRIVSGETYKNNRGEGEGGIPPPPPPPFRKSPPLSKIPPPFENPPPPF